MSATSLVNVGLLGVGVVGSAVARALSEKAAWIEQHAGVPVRVKTALVRDASRSRPGLPADLTLTTDPDAILGDPDISIVVEVMGGEQPALSYIQKALHRGKHVVTANKEVLAKHGPEIFAHAVEHGVGIRFEAAAGGGIPIVGPLLTDLAANELTAVNAIINGTTNYMLTRMASEHLGYAEALAEAQRLGYAEPEPSADVEGLDAAYKLAILGSLAFHTTIRADDVFAEGIASLTPADFDYAAELGYVIKLLAVGRRIGSSIQARVHPVFLPMSNPLANVDGVNNAVELEGDLVGWVMCQGPGAGPAATSSAVLGDVIAAVRALSGEPAPAPRLDAQLAVEPMEELRTKYYLRLRAADQPGVMAQITRVLGDRAVSLASVIQKETGEDGSSAEIVVTTHTAREADVQDALQELARLDVVLAVDSLIRVEDGTA